MSENLGNLFIYHKNNISSKIYVIQLKLKQIPGNGVILGQYET